jgi:hypothetical protein
VLEESHWTDQDYRPRSRLTISAGKCSQVAEANRVELQFLTDRLSSVNLIVPDPRAYFGGPESPARLDPNP